MNNQDYWKGIDRKFRLPRVWSNRELAKFANLFTGSVVNVSGWKDIDKEGRTYKSYFSQAENYTITNYKSEARGFQGYENEIFLDLTKPLPEELNGKFEVVFNHTVLEHIFEVQTAFKNLCDMTRDIAIIIVPFLQEMHADYGDYWRFTPQALDKLFSSNNMKMVYCTFNSHTNASVYLFSIATKNEEKWKDKIPFQTTHEDPFKLNDSFQNWVGCHAIQNPSFERRKAHKKNILTRLRTKLTN